MFFFVHPDHRRTNYAKTLIAWAKHFSDRMGLVLELSVYNDKRTEAKTKLCNRMLEPLGGLFIHNRMLGGKYRG